MIRVFRGPSIGVIGALLVVLGVGVAARSPQQRESANPRERQVIATVVDARTNKPVTGLPAAAFAIREDNQDREILRVEPATDPMSVILLADTTTAFRRFERDLRTAPLAFFRTFMAAHPGSFAALWEFGGAGTPVQGLTSNGALLEQATTRLVPKGTISDLSDQDLERGSVRGQNVVASNLLEGVRDAARELGKEQHTRRVIVSFNSDLSVEATTLPGQKIQDDVQKANVTWFAVSIHTGITNGPLRDNVMEGLIPYSGGMRVTIGDVAALEPSMKNLADVLASQYVVTYVRPSGSSPKILAIGIRAQGLKVMAPHWAPK
jgi:hypothetical protein